MLDLEGFRNYLYEEELAPNTIDSYMTGIQQYSERYAEITKANVLEFKAEIAKQFRPATVNLRLTAILRYCDYKEIAMKVKNVKEPKKTHFENVITLEQYDRLISGLKNDNDERWIVNIKMLAKTGMRISEAIRVKKCDLERGYVTMPTKAHMRTIYFPKSLVDDMKPWLDKLKDNEIVMQNLYGRPVTSRGVSERLLDFARKYDIPKEVMHPHSFRHFFAIEFIKRKNDISLLADLLGHGDVKVTQIYLRQSQEQQQRAVDEAVDW